MRVRLQRWWRYPFAVGGPLSVLFWTSIAVAGVVGALLLRRPWQPVPGFLVLVALSSWIAGARRRYAESRSVSSAQVRRGRRTRDRADVIVAAVAVAIALGLRLNLGWAIAIYAGFSFAYEVERRRKLAAQLEADPRWARGWTPAIDPAYEFVAVSHLSAKEYEKARELLEKGLALNPQGMRRSYALYNLACAEARLDDRDAALQHLSEAVKDPHFRKRAQKDDDLASIKDDPRFPAA